MLHVKPLLLHVPHLHTVVHEHARDKVEGGRAQLDVRHAHLAEGKDLLETVREEVVEVNV